jgi:hypothetical protein
MAISSICGQIKRGFDASCLNNLTRKYYQQAVLINRSDIDNSTIVIEVVDNGDAGTPPVSSCKHRVSFSLKAGATGYRITLPENGSSVFGSFAKTNSDFGFAQYQHIVNLAMIGVDESTKCMLNALDKGSVVVALQIGNVIEIYGLQNGLQTGDYTYDVQGGAGGSVLTLQSIETAPEQHVPYIYNSTDPIADFDSNF